jgi:predicted DNA-binding transcriptional regulator AlpA
MGRPEVAPVERVTYSIAEFCAAHGISRWLYYKMKKDGTGPREMRIGDRAFITIESATKWRRAQERKGTPQPERGAQTQAAS